MQIDSSHGYLLLTTYYLLLTDGQQELREHADRLVSWAAGALEMAPDEQTAFEVLPTSYFLLPTSYF